jgi:XTP/dITP diphosphohydrolase
MSSSSSPADASIHPVSPHQAPHQAANSATSTDLLAALQHLVDVVARLRSPTDGCPWDLAQTHATLIPYMTEEAYEAVDAIRHGSAAALCDELGDVLLQVVLHAQIASEAGEFSLQDVAHGISAKLIRRHPHVFGDAEIADEAELRQVWDQIKATEKGEDPTIAPTLSQKLHRYSRTLPPLTAASKISQKAAAAGFEWETVEGVWDKFQEELAEFQTAIAEESPAHQQAELGDLFFTLINLARWYDLDPDAAIDGTNQRFIQRLALMESVADRPLADYRLDELETLWQQAKQTLGQ